MSKSEVYSWRIAPELKQRLEIAACEAGVSLGQLLENAAVAWLEHGNRAGGDEAEQQRLREALMGHVGAIASGNATGSMDVKRNVRELIRSKIEDRSRRGSARAD